MKLSSIKIEQLLANAYAEIETRKAEIPRALHRAAADVAQGKKQHVDIAAERALLRNAEDLAYGLEMLLLETRRQEHQVAIDRDRADIQLAEAKVAELDAEHRRLLRPRSMQITFRGATRLINSSRRLGTSVTSSWNILVGSENKSSTSRRNMRSSSETPAKNRPRAGNRSPRKSRLVTGPQYWFSVMTPLTKAVLYFEECLIARVRDDVALFTQFSRLFNAELLTASRAAKTHPQGWRNVARMLTASIGEFERCAVSLPSRASVIDIVASAGDFLSCDKHLWEAWHAATLIHKSEQEIVAPRQIRAVIEKAKAGIT